ncbi:MAG: glycogen/starch/alpha-glucan phosphorylase, partial [Clostridia bacterium]|nr:glycogen/starch/alpha-glucan phosphorylase [Clostridia bacterium]
VIDKDPDVKGRLKVAYLEDYRVTLAETLMPAADLSEQISLAGTEASGTGNMKLMINGAVTIGTADGANVEMHRAVGDDNIIIFGMSSEEVAALKPHYNPQAIYQNNNNVRNVIDLLKNPHYGIESPTVVSSLVNADPYMVLADFDSYCDAHRKADALYADKETWGKMMVTNIAKAGIFASDRSIMDYAKGIWHTK